MLGQYVSLHSYRNIVAHQCESVIERQGIEKEHTQREIMQTHIQIDVYFWVTWGHVLMEREKEVVV